MKEQLDGLVQASKAKQPAPAPTPVAETEDRG